ncbi:unnamed protein product [Pleuronectes platessa]|uniref:Uncharacterized protein n=1 Tax=Pleuronectes platessa TaxID=8262 RepID=A0A9N7V7K3_PLEPL|nr:unnamed protein product [Pleuronectes platessa]
MVQKILNKFVGAKYITILRTWIPNMVAWGTGSSTRMNKVSHNSTMTRAWEWAYCIWVDCLQIEKLN